MDDRLQDRRDFGWLWRAFAISSLGTWLAFDAFPLIAVLTLHSSAVQVSVIAAASATVAALMAIPLGPVIERRAKRPLMIRADLIRFVAMLTVPVAYGLGRLSYPQLLLVAMIVALADIVFVAASGAHLKSLVAPDRLLAANGSFETVTWVCTAIGPPTGGMLIGLVGPVFTVIIDAVSYLLSALGIRAIRSPESPPVVTPAASRRGEVSEGWKTIATDRILRLLFVNSVLTGALILATAPLLTYRLMHDLHFTTFEYGLAFGVPCLGGIAGSRASAPLVRRFGERRILLTFGVVRAIWLVGLPFTGPGLLGLPLVMLVEGGMIFCMGVFNPVYATLRLQRSPNDRVARVLTAWRISSRVAIAAVTALLGLVAAVTSAQIALAIAGVCLLTTPLFLPWRATNGYCAAVCRGWETGAECADPSCHLRRAA